MSLPGYSNEFESQLHKVSVNNNPLISLVVIDDNSGSLELLSTALKQPDLQIYTAEDPIQGLELIRQHRPEIVLTDLVMPNMSGLDLLDRVV